MLRISVWLLAGHAASILPTNSSAAETPVRIVNLAPGQALHLRAEPHARSKVLAYIRQTMPEPITFIGPCVDKWCRISFRGLNGWASRRFLDFADDGAASAGGAAQIKPSQSLAAAPTQPGETRPDGRPAAMAALPPAAPGGEAKLFSVAGVLADEFLSLREAPEDSAAIKAAIPHDAKDIEGAQRCVAKWCLVRYQGVAGWVLRRHLADESQAAGRRWRIAGIDIATVVSVKEYPAEEAGEVGNLPSYASGVVQIGLCDKEWCHIRYLGIVGWVRTRFLQPEATPRT